MRVYHARKGSRTPDQILAHREVIARRYLRGDKQTDIAADLGVSQQTISVDLKAIRKAWLESSLRDFDEMKAQELAKIDQLEVTYWEAWDKSLQDVTEQTQYANSDREGNPVPERAVINVRTGLGDNRWLEGVKWCIDKRLKILGMETNRVDVTSAGKQLQTGIVTVYLPDNGRGDGGDNSGPATPLP